MTSPNPVSYNNGATTVGTTPTPIANVVSNNAGVLVQNTSESTTVYLGGPNVAASGDDLGFALAGNSYVHVPSNGSYPLTLFAVTASDTATVVVLFPSGQ